LPCYCFSHILRKAWMHKSKTFPKCQASTLVGNCFIQGPYLGMASPLDFGGHSHKARLCTILVWTSPGIILGMATPLGGIWPTMISWML
jgi:hypothetical protein